MPIDRYQNYLVRAIRKIRVRQCPVPFVIWFKGRSGSSHLCSLLNAHPAISCREEDFHPVFPDANNDLADGNSIQMSHGRRASRRLLQFDKALLVNPSTKITIKHLHDIFSQPLHACGFKFKYPNQHELFPEILNELQAIGPKLHIIMLSRNNVLKQAISRQNLDRLRTQFGQIANLPADKTYDEFKSQPFSIDVQRTLTNARRLLSEHSQFCSSVQEFQAATHGKLLNLNYEALQRQELDSLNRVFSFLGVAPNVQVTSCYQKATSDKLEQTIVNFAELHDAVAGTEFESMLQE